MKNKIRQILNSVSPKILIGLLWVFVLFILTVYTGWKVYSFFSFNNSNDRPQITVKIDPENSIKELSKLLKHNEHDLFKPGFPTVKNIILINTKNKQLLFQEEPKKEPVIIKFTKTDNNLIQKVAPESEIAFDNLVINYLNVPNYFELLEKTENINKDIKTQIGSNIGANEKYISQIADKWSKDIRSILFSLIYNTVLSGSPDHIATTIENKKLKAITSNNYKIDRVNSEKLAKALINLKANADNAEAKFIETKYNKLHHHDTFKSIPENDLQKQIDKFLGIEAVQLNAPVDFVFVNFKDDILYCGSKAYPYNPTTLLASDINSLDFLFEKQLSLSNYKSLSALDIVRKIGVPDTLVNSADANLAHSQIVFKALIRHLLDYPSIYFIADGKLQFLFDLETSSVKYGKFNTQILQKGINEIIQDTQSQTEFLIVKKENNTPIIIYITLIVLFFSFITILILYRRKDALGERVPIDETGETSENNEKEEIQKQVKKTEKETIKKVIQYLTKPGEDLKYETPELKEIRYKNSFYEKIRKTEKLSEFIQVIEREGREKFHIKRIPSAEDVFKQAEQEKTNTDKILYLLNRYDDSLTGNTKTLSDEFKELRKTKESNDKLGLLILENYKVDFYDYLKSHISKIEDNQSVESFVRFGLLFKTSSKSKFRSESEILLNYNETGNAIDEFYKKYQRISESKLLERTALLCWSLELADRLINIRKKTSLNIDFDKIKQDQLQLIATRYFIHNSKNQSKTENDFKLSIEDGNERIKVYNNQISDSVSFLNLNDSEYLENISVLKDLIRKIKKYENTELAFTKLYQHFVSDFIENIENLRFNEREVIAEDRSWLFQQLFNIAFHTADYVEHFIKEDDERYHSNFLFLKNDFDLSKTEHRQFTENDMEQSTRASNIVVKTARFAGVKKLNILVNKYYINPEHLI